MEFRPIESITWGSSPAIDLFLPIKSSSANKYYYCFQDVTAKTSPQPSVLSTGTQGSGYDVSFPAGASWGPLTAGHSYLIEFFYV
jgi:hypothetical protein